MQVFDLILFKGLIVFTSGAITTDLSTSFVILLVTFLAIKFVIRFLVPDTPESANLISQRHKNAVDRVSKGIKKSYGKLYKPTRTNLRVGGVIYKEMDEGKGGV